MASGPQAALRRRALQWLAQREHSRQELRGKLQRWWSAQAARAPQGDAPPIDEAAIGVLIGEVLEALQAQGHLSETRLVETRLHARQSKFGIRRIEHELSGLGVTLGPAEREALAQTELERARQVLQRRFGADGPASPQEKARRMRFLAARGFTGETIRCVMRVQAPALGDSEDQPIRPEGRLQTGGRAAGV